MKKPAITTAELRALTAIAARCTASPHEAEDIVQDILLAAIRSGRVCGGDGFLPWARGAIRNHSRFLARSAGRRRRRETVHQELQAVADGCGGETVERIPQDVIDDLSPALRIVALLVNLGMNKAEIACLLELSDQTLRQRIHALRKAVSRQSVESEPAHTDIAAKDAPGLARRRLKAAIPPHGERRFAIRDPDGMGIFFSSAHISGGNGNL